MIRRREFLAALTAGVSVVGAGLPTIRRSLAATTADSRTGGVRISEFAVGEDLFAYIQRTRGRFDLELYKQLLGAANEFKEGDQIVGVAAADETSRAAARALLAAARAAEIDRHPVLEDRLHTLSLAARDASARELSRSTLGELKKLLLEQDETAIKARMTGWSSDVIACLVKLMTNEELCAVGAKVFNTLPGSQIGARGYLGARIQPNSPTDNVDDIRWQVLDGWSYAVGDVLLGTNPVSSEPKSVAAVERTLKDLLVTFGIDDAMPHCVLSHIDVQAAVERAEPGSTELWFQSLAGSDKANAVFDVGIEKMVAYARERTSRFGFYFETGQGADFTNGQGHGYDMLLHESRKYGFIRALTAETAAARRRAGLAPAPWIHVNDVAGFIGPEVFRSREQLVRCCLEDIVMGKLHGLTIGLDVCSTLHMDVSLDDLDWCLERLMPAHPAYLMALPTKIDPMLGYLTTGFQDHVRLREKFGRKVNDRMQRFFQQLGVVDAAGRPTEHFGDPAWVYLQYRRRKQDERDDATILAEAREQIAGVRSRGLFLAAGHAEKPWQLEPTLEKETRRIYADAKQSIWTELSPEFIAQVPDRLPLATRSVDRTQYILHPETGERLDAPSQARLLRLREEYAGRYDVQIVVSDGLNALAIMDDGHLAPYLEQLHAELAGKGLRVAPQHLVLTSGRVRAGYRIGETLFAGLSGPRVIVHVIGERPGSGHHTFSVYITAPLGELWGKAGSIDHNITKVVSGVAVTALQPRTAAQDTARLLRTMM